MRKVQRCIFCFSLSITRLVSILYRNHAFSLRVALERCEPARKLHSRTLRHRLLLSHRPRLVVHKTPSFLPSSLLAERRCHLNLTLILELPILHNYPDHAVVRSSTKAIIRPRLFLKVSHLCARLRPPLCLSRKISVVQHHTLRLPGHPHVHVPGRRDRGLPC